MSALTLEDKVAARAAVVDRMLWTHGGGVEVDDCDGETVRVRFTGLCTACPMRPLTIARIVTPAFEDLEGVQVEVVGVRLSSQATERLSRR